MRRNHLRKIVGQRERTRLIQSEVQSAKQLPLRSQFRSTLAARFQVRLESFQGAAIQLAVEIGRDVFELAILLFNGRNVHRIVCARVRRTEVLSNLLWTGDTPLEQMIAHGLTGAE